MSNDFFPFLLAASNGLRYLYFLGIMAVLVVVPYIISTWFAKTMRMGEFGSRMGIVFTSLVVGTAILVNGFMNDGMKYGVDLAGGVILIYEVDVDSSSDPDDPNAERDKINMTELVAMLNRRINPSGTKEIVVRAFGIKQVEIIIPKVDDLEIEEIKEQIRSAGMLEFQIVATTRDHSSVINAAREQARKSLAIRRQNEVSDNLGNPVGRWVKLGREQAEKRTDNPDDKNRPFRVDPLGLGGQIRDGQTGEFISLTPTEQQEIQDKKAELHEVLKKRQINDVEILMVIDDFNVTGSEIATVRRDFDQTLNPCVQFTMKDSGSALMGRLTGSNLPDPTTGQTRQLGIVLDNNLLSAPAIQSRISDSGQITGNFTQREVDKLVNILNAGKLPNALVPTPISENKMGAQLGADTIRKGAIAIGASGALVIVFILFYYRFAGMIACLALVINIALTIAIMMLIRATLTLPGLAGLVLTVGMSVDANVLIFERIREEINRGSALRLAIRNGFARATTTIVDANLTTLITALVLYAIGTEQVKGFAVTLILGILMSMYTAIFCSRLVFDTAERARRLKSLSMANIIGKTQIDFVSKQMVAAMVSVVFIAIGLVAVGARGKGIFDIDFNGGVSVVMQIDKNAGDLTIGKVRDELDKLFAKGADGTAVQYSVSRVEMDDANNVAFKVQTDMQNVDELQDKLKSTFSKTDGSTMLVTYAITKVTKGKAKMKSNSTNETTLPGLNESGRGGGFPAGNKNSADKGDKKAGNSKGSDTKSETKGSKGTGDDKTVNKSKAGSKSKTKAPAPSKGGKKKADSKGAKKAEPAKKKTTDTKGKKKADSKGAKGKKKTSQLIGGTGQSFVAYNGPVLQVAQADGKKGKAKAAGKKLDAGKGPSQPKQAKKKADSKKSDTKVTPAGKKKTDSKGSAGTKKSDTKSKADKKDDGAFVPPDPNKTTPKESRGGSLPTSADGHHWQVPFDVEFKFEINRKTLQTTMRNAAKENKESERPGIPLIDIEAQPADAALDAENRRFKKWKVSLFVQNEQDAQAIIDRSQADLLKQPVWQSSNKIDSTVSVYFRNAAIAALLASLIGIVAYIWIRFQRVTYGLAAVVALVHDVLITLGAIAVSFWLTPLSFLQIEEFKISLPVVAAFLTIIGYSLNDTIVVFDRIREVKGKSPDLTGDMINTSINQTLSRTLLTSLTTLIVVLILYFFGGQGIHTFAYALVVGVLVGTYSSIFVASPVLLWMTQRRAAA